MPFTSQKHIAPNVFKHENDTGMFPAAKIFRTYSNRFIKNVNILKYNSAYYKYYMYKVFLKIFT